MKPTALVRYIAFLLFALILVSCNDQGDEMEMKLDDEMEDMDSPSGATLAPDFTLESFAGGEVSLSDFEDKPLVIFFFGSSCPLCRSSAPSIETEINEAFSSEEIGMIGIDTWDGSRSAVENFQDRTGVTFDLLLKGSKVESAYKTTYDRLVVVNGEGEIEYKGSSSASKSVDDVVELINELLQ